MANRTPVTVIIPTYNGQSLLEKNLPLVLAALHPEDAVVIVDDASTDATVAHLRTKYHLVSHLSPIQQTELFESTHKGITVKLLLNHQNQRFGMSCNRGVQIATTPIVILLNNDATPLENTFDLLRPHFNDPGVFAVGCKERAARENNKEYGRAEAHFERGFLVHRRTPDQDAHTTYWASGGSSAFRKSIWEMLGGFDPLFYPAYWEDIDLSFRARSLGFLVLFEPKAIVIHDHETTHETVFGKRQVEVIGYKNALLFMWKNAKGKQLLLHLVWLPYHLVYTTIRSRGVFLVGLGHAIRQQFKRTFLG